MIWCFVAGEIEELRFLCTVRVFFLRRIWEVKNGGSTILTMSEDARSEDCVCVDAVVV
jgi:hypothetical protein